MYIFIYIYDFILSSYFVLKSEIIQVWHKVPSGVARYPPLGQPPILAEQKAGFDDRSLGFDGQKKDFFDGKKM